MAAATHRDEEMVRTGENHGVDDVHNACASDNEARLLIDHTIPALAGIVIASIPMG
jgi:hypothetical protein